MQRKQGSPLLGSITEARGFVSGKICRGNYDSAVYMESQAGLPWVAPKEKFDSFMVKLWFESTALHYYKCFIK